MALENVGAFQIPDVQIKKTTNLALKKIEGPQFFNTRGPIWPLKVLGYLNPVHAKDSCRYHNFSPSEVNVK